MKKMIILMVAGFFLNTAAFAATGVISDPKCGPVLTKVDEIVKAHKNNTQPAADPKAKDKSAETVE